MKIYSKWFLLLLLLTTPFWGGVAVAHEAVRVYEHSSGVGLGDFHARLQAAGYLEGEVFSTDILGSIAFDYAKEKNYLRLVPASNRTKESYIDLFKRWNALGDTITLTEFRRKGQMVGFWLPVDKRGEQSVIAIAELAQSLQVLQGELKQLSSEGGEHAVLLREQVSGLTAQLGALNSDNAELLGTLNLLEQRLTGKLSQQASSGTDTVMQEVGVRLENVIGSLHSRLEAVEKTMSGHSERIGLLEERPEVGVVWLWLAIALIAIITVLTLVSAWRWNTKGRQIIRAVNERVETVEKNHKELSGRMEEFDDTVSRVETRARDIEEVVYGIRFNPTLITRARLAAMKKGETVVLPVLDQKGQEFRVEVTRDQDELTLSGVQRRKGDGKETMTVPLSTHVPSLIAKAGKEGRLTNPQEGGATKRSAA